MTLRRSAGGIDVNLMGVINARRDWKNTLYTVHIIVVVVIATDSISGWRRKRLIRSPGGN